MAEAKKFDPDKSESLKKQFDRFASRMKRRWNKEPITLDDINVIKLPSTSVYSLEPSYFATRNEGGKWNIEAKTVIPGGEVGPIVESVAGNLDLPEALDLMAAKNPAGMQFDTKKFWHPASVAKLIGHEIKPAVANKNLPKAAGMTA